MKLLVLTITLAVALSSASARHGHHKSSDEFGMGDVNMRAIQAMATGQQRSMVMGGHGKRAGGRRGGMSKSVSMVNLFRIPSNVELKKSAKYTSVMKSGAKGKQKTFKNFDATWKTDIKEVRVWKNQNITQLKSLHNEGRLKGRAGDQKLVKAGAVKVVKAAKKTHMKPKKLAVTKKSNENAFFSF